MKTPREIAEGVVEGYHCDVATGTAPGIALADMIEVSIAEAVAEERERCARVALSVQVGSYSVAVNERIAAVIRAGEGERRG